ncbi:helix-turn-helix domain-containing protein [Spirosoma sp. HMF4905]|uniref:Helix-turn-helix domain-containing protein n=1 Tax=Spirosoma arboris TaxID=2682092 RepID=A0A7K1SQY9_9BACT|nr:helix-turn-helix transcriptional regulator [Spirosoma arboris]MVM36224.1 helix-turn-helix domain-containing protein [Spirosoma arboris]
MAELKKQVGSLIKQARKAKGFTQKELGEKLGVGRVTINGYEAGSQNLTLDTLQKIAEALGIEPKSFFE